MKAATGEVVSAEELGGADVHCKTSGVCDHYAHNDEHALTIARSIVENLNASKHSSSTFLSHEEPLYPMSNIGSIVPADPKKPFDIRKIIARIADGSRFHEFKEYYSPSIVTGFLKLYGMQIGTC